MRVNMFFNMLRIEQWRGGNIRRTISSGVVPSANPLRHKDTEDTTTKPILVCAHPPPQGWVALSHEKCVNLLKMPD